MYQPSAASLPTIWTLSKGGRIASCAPAVEGVARTFTWVVVMPVTGTVVGVGVGGTGVGVMDGMGVGGRVAVMMKGVAAPGAVMPVWTAQPARASARSMSRRVGLFTAQL